jgi:ELWxxDGT repeat protein
MRQGALALLFSLPFSIAIHAQTPYLVKDINVSTTASATSSGSHGFFLFGSRVFFVATTSTGAELWSTDGTETGTAQVADINPGSSSSSPSLFAEVNGKLLFNARDSSHGEELWVTDGTSAGTRLLADINPGTRASLPGDRIVYHDQMIFAADDGIDGSELWTTDGTPTGTRFFKDLYPGAGGSNPSSFVLFHDLIYFSAAGGLWKSDGTPAGTVLVKPACGPINLTVAGSHLFFSGYLPETGNEPWVSDGTESGTHMIMDIRPGSQQSMYYPMTAFGDSVLFAAVASEFDARLWISDGTTAGTHQVDPGVVNDSQIVVIGGTAFYTATTSATGQELWKTDGTAAGTTLVRDIVPGSEGSGPRGLVAAGSRLFFVALSAGNLKLWVTDGTSAGTRQVTTTEPSPVVQSAGPSTLTYLNGILYFSGANRLNGFEPWKSDGTDVGTSMIANIASDGVPSSLPRNLTAAGDWIYFDAWDGGGTVTSNGGEPRSLWRSDGTPEGTLKLVDAPVGLTMDPYFSVGRSLFFNRSGLWTTDGTPESTGPASAFMSRFSSTPTVVFVMGDKIFASVTDSSLKSGLWITTTAPNAPAVSLDCPSGYGFVDVAGRAIFFASTDSFFFTNSLWISDGTAAGTRALVSDLGDALDGKAAVMGGQLYFATRSNSGGNAKLWKSDGTSDGTLVVKTFPQITGMLTPAGRNLFFITAGQLWITDGTDAGTRSLPATPFAAGVLAACGDRVVFPAVDPSGNELWVSDGTAEGTHLLSDIYPGAANSFPTDLTTIEGLVYFTATDNLHGTETWVTDGTPAGTKLVADVALAGVVNTPRQYVRAGERLFFAATTSETGNELWALPLPSTPRLTINDIRVAEGDSGTVTARFTVTLSTAPATTVAVDYATWNGTATAGIDYEAATGTLTFAAGETSKTIDVLVHGNSKPENNRSVFAVLRNATGATMAKATGFAIIEDDDQIADVGLSLDFSQVSSFKTFVKATNNGPRTATNIKLQRTGTPPFDSEACSACPPIAQLAPGDVRSAWDYNWPGFQQYVTATVSTATPRDPESSNNSVGWIDNGSISMDALYLTPGTQANVWYYGFTNLPSVSIESSNPSVLSVPASVPILGSFKPSTFVVHALSVGTATIRVFSPASSDPNTLTVDVVPSGTKPRWPGALNAYVQPFLPFDRQLTLTVLHTATAPYTGERPTGLVTITSNGHELARATLTSTDGDRPVAFYLPALGTTPITLSYAGDANFRPETTTSNIVVLIGNVTLLAGAERFGTTARVHVKATGSPLAGPSGTVTISEAGIVPLTPITLVDTGSGIAQGDVTLTNIAAGPHTFVISYSGDAHYNAATQNVRIVEPRTHAIRH